MKSATLPSIRVEPEFRTAVESLLHEGESLSQFVENAVRDTLMQRQHQSEFLARGIQSLETARQSNDYVEADDMLAQLRDQLAKARSQVHSRRA
ncbi:prevent-host-death protein [Limnohabitans sp. Rim8]|jgi:Arc/MetJ-type ribon-helix-helix transcriptional regulator|uniref:Prevent-host-death protein n=1 Tax=Limnohabitans curvus TaxID=323423 RepID=A0A315EV64_9BURK|nr:MULTISPECIES: YlcI/YnfO family protein [Limnohabitans]PUE57837.1 prevent-host-death protein [Limnohabitans sp. Rim8]PUE59904.1 prevent-host-death protein [Limnohabitans curvus]